MDSVQASDATNSPLETVDDLLRSGELQHRPRRSHRQGPIALRAAPQPARPIAKGRAGAVETLRAGVLTQAGVRHGFSTRTGGVSTVYADGGGGTLNLGFTSADTREIVLENRSRLLTDVFGQALPLVSLRQIHSSLTYRVNPGDAGTTRRGDGLIADEPGLVLGIQTADCVPVLVADPVRGAVAAFHAGWRGTLRRIVEGGVGRMCVEFGCEPQDMVAAIGPAIGTCCYGVGEEVASEFGSQFAYAEELFSENYDVDPVREKYPMLFLSARAPGHSGLGPKLHLDLQEASRRQLLACGLRPDAIEVMRYCTSCETDRFFSYRAENGQTGRMMAVIEAGRADRGRVVPPGREWD